MQPTDYDTALTKTTAGRVHNFSAGPAVLPLEVLEEIREELPIYRDVGSSVMEISHRSAAYSGIEEDAKRRMRELLGLDEGWHVLFLQGGASMQFYQVPLNFLPPESSADYLITGSWAKKAFKEAGHVGRVRAAAGSEDRNFCYIPDPANWDLDPKAAYLHFTSNNTIFGTQFRTEPNADVPLVCDASSDLLGRSIDVARYGLIYAGAQKNLGPAGVTVVLIRDDFLQRRNQFLPAMLDYGTHAAGLYNTPPVFAVYAVGKVLKWLSDRGGLDWMGAVNERKAGRLYQQIDKTGFYRGTADRESRSRMNVTFRLPSVELETAFLVQAKEAGLLGLKGHRSVGGLRASIYNACPEESVNALVSFMEDFEKAKG